MPFVNNLTFLAGPESQVVEFLVERPNLIAPLLYKSFLILRSSTPRRSVVTLALLCRADCHVELGDLVCVLTWCRHFDRSSPVEVEVTKGVDQLLQIYLLELRLVHGHMEMGGEDTTLVCTRRHHEEIKCALWVRMLD